MITHEQVEAALKAWYDAGDAGNFASMFAALKAAELTSCARIAELEAENRVLRNEYKVLNRELTEMQGKYEAARAALGEKK